MSEAKILVIDDEPGIREGCKRALNPQGYHVDAAESGDEGIQKVLANGFDLVLIDVMMPGISGIDLIASIHQHDPEIVCIIITGYATVELAVRAIKQGAYDFLTKPFTSDDLLLAVNQGLERRRLSLEAKRLQEVEIQAQRLAEEKNRLEELDKAKVAFIRLVTHELQAPIAAIQNYLRLMLDGYIPPEQQKEYIQRAEERASEQLALIADLLEFGKLREVKTIGRVAPVQVDEIMQKVIEEFSSQIDHKNLQLTVQIEPDLPVVNAVPGQVKSLWSNLISNAIKYTPQGGYVAVTLQTDGDKLISTVEDSGIGITEKDMQHLFEEFFRTDQAKASGETGTGLGLSIVKQIVESYGGEIKVTSQLGQGSRFLVSLPLTPAAAKPLDKPADLPQAETGRFPVRLTTHTRAFVEGQDSES